MEKMQKTSNGFQMFMGENPEIGQAFMGFVTKISEQSALDAKTHELAYISVLSVLNLAGGLPFHVLQAKQKGATLEEVKSAVLVGMPVAGLQVMDAYAVAINTYCGEE